MMGPSSARSTGSAGSSTGVTPKAGAGLAAIGGMGIGGMGGGGSGASTPSAAAAASVLSRSGSRKNLASATAGASATSSSAPAGASSSSSSSATPKGGAGASVLSPPAASSASSASASAPAFLPHPPSASASASASEQRSAGPSARPTLDAPAIDTAGLLRRAGQTPLRALSRGGAFCLFVDTDETARGAIRTNLDALNLLGAGRVHRRDATDLGLRPASDGAPFDLAFLDPPYGKGLGQAALAGLLAGGWLAPGALAVLERGADEPRVEVGGFELLDEREWGPASVSFLRAP